MIIAERAARVKSEARAAQAQSELANAQAATSSTEALIARLKLEIEKLRRELLWPSFGAQGPASRPVEIQLEEAEADASEDELAAEQAARSTMVNSFARRAADRESHSPPICGASASSSPRRRAAPAAARRSCRSSARTSPRRWRSSRGNGRWFRRCASGSPAGNARRSRSRRRPSMSRRAASPGRIFWR